MAEECIISHTVTFQNTEEAARLALQPINESRPPNAIIEVMNAPTSLEKEYDDQAAANPSHHRYCCDNAFIDNGADVVDVLEKAFTTLPHEKAFSLWYAMNPCSRRKPSDMALSLQSDHYFALYTVWESAEDDVRCKAWVQDIMAGVERHADGAYLGDSDFQVRRTKYWGEEQGRKLMDIRRKWDPKGVFCGYLDQGDLSGTKGLENVHEF